MIIIIKDYGLSGSPPTPKVSLKRPRRAKTSLRFSLRILTSFGPPFWRQKWYQKSPEFKRKNMQFSTFIFMVFSCNQMSFFWWFSWAFLHQFTRCSICELSEYVWNSNENTSFPIWENITKLYLFCDLWIAFSMFWHAQNSSKNHCKRSSKLYKNWSNIGHKKRWEKVLQKIQTGDQKWPLK